MFVTIKYSMFHKPGLSYLSALLLPYIDKISDIIISKSIINLREVLWISRCLNYNSNALIKQCKKSPTLTISYKKVFAFILPVVE